MKKLINNVFKNMQRSFLFLRKIVFPLGFVTTPKSNILKSYRKIMLSMVLSTRKTHNFDNLNICLRNSSDDIDITFFAKHFGI